RGRASLPKTHDPSEFGRFVQQRHALEERLKDMEKQRLAYLEIQKQAEECLNQFLLHLNDLTSKRTRFLESILLNNPYVQIVIKPFGNRENAYEEFRSLINRSQMEFDKDIGAADNNEGLVGSLYRSAERDFEKKCYEMKDKIYKIRDGDISLVKDKRFAAHIQNLAPEVFDRIECWFPGDSIEVSYSTFGHRDFKPIHQGSPGQKTAALLSFILSYGDEPLILDQPEDDLDNNLIYDLIVTQLRDIKQKRQVIVVTHNANIVVNGDSELIIALEIRSGQTKKVGDCESSLQNTTMRREICRIMEGGREAFEKRFKRIMSGECSF
ncbi:MAG: AAA family ATPase, partial [Vulcanimicrobiota bacterium]